MRGIVLFAHGARDPEWARPFEEIRGRIRSRRPEVPVALAYLEAMRPTLAEAVDVLVEEGAVAITVFPLFMAQGGHLRHDVPVLLEALRARHPRVPLSLESAIGDVPEIVAAIAAWIIDRSE